MVNRWLNTEVGFMIMMLETAIIDMWLAQIRDGN